MICREWDGFAKWSDVEHMTSARCIYAIFVDDECVYIGQTSSLLPRIASHRRTARFKETVPSHITWHAPTSAYTDIKGIERFLIAHYKPRFNKSFVGCKSATKKGKA